MKLTIRRLALALLLFAATAGTVRAQDAAAIERTGIQLARFNKPGALYAFLRDQAPSFFAVADGAGLAEAIDGGQDVARFQQRVEQLLRNSNLSAAEKTKAEAEAQAAFKAIQAIRAETAK